MVIYIYNPYIKKATIATKQPNLLI